MAIYIQIFPEDAAHMLKYMSTIKTIYEMKGNESFRYYDETFRLLRKENSQPWQQEIDELHRKAMFMKSSKFTPTTIFYNHQSQQNTLMVLLLTQTIDGFCPYLTQITITHATSTTNTNVVQKETVPINMCAKCVKDHTLNSNVANKLRSIKSINPIQNKIPSSVNPEVLSRELQVYKKFNL
jgi:hypothetical protein